ncbi:MAG: hypothetical protein SOT67_01495 [Bacteroidaceae bacterium]|nr:hypothetical protein [Bacteroidaceae bacterium]
MIINITNKQQNVKKKIMLFLVIQTLYILREIAGEYILLSPERCNSNKVSGKCALLTDFE